MLYVNGVSRKMQKNYSDTLCKFASETHTMTAYKGYQDSQRSQDSKCENDVRSDKTYMLTT